MSAWWKGLSSRLRGVMILTAMGVAVAAGSAMLPFLVCEETAEAGERTIQMRREERAREARAWREQLEREMAESAERLQRSLDESRRRSEEARRLAEETSPPPRKRRVRRWVWESPADTRSKLWNVPEAESTTATATALLRICISEADGNEADCIGIWQVLKNVRIRGCDRNVFRRITECDEGGETMLSVMRRAQKFATGTVPPRSRRARWIAELTLGCEQPPSFPGTDRQWEQQYDRTCSRTSELARRLVDGEDYSPAIRGARAIAWGGRCEDARGACDDPLACARGLARIRNTGTLNAFWCRPGTRGCTNDIDPICLEMGHRSLRENGEPTASAEETPLPAIAGMVSPHEGS